LGTFEPNITHAFDVCALCPDMDGEEAERPIQRVLTNLCVSLPAPSRPSAAPCPGPGPRTPLLLRRQRRRRRRLPGTCRPKEVLQEDDPEAPEVRPLPVYGQPPVGVAVVDEGLRGQVRRGGWAMGGGRKGMTEISEPDQTRGTNRREKLCVGVGSSIGGVKHQRKMGQNTK